MLVWFLEGIPDPQYFGFLDPDRLNKRIQLSTRNCKKNTDFTTKIRTVEKPGLLKISLSMNGLSKL